MSASRGERVAVFGLTFAVYLLAAILLVFAANLVTPQALGSVGSAHNILFSRDPHLAAVGFVGLPLPSLLLLLLVPLKGLWPDLVRLAFAANLLSAALMAAAVLQLHGLLSDARLPRAPRLLATSVFALHPTILYAAASGMGEAGLLLFLLVAVRGLARWLATGAVGALAIAGLGLALACLTSYEAFLAAFGVVIVVVAIDLAHQPAMTRRMIAITDGLIVSAPTLVALLAWAAASWLITGDPFHEASSVYGYGSQLHALAGQLQGSNAWLALAMLLALEPGLPLAVWLCLSAARRGIEPRALAVVATFVPVLATMTLAISLIRVLPWLRYDVLVIPGVVVLVTLFAFRPQPVRARGAGALPAIATAVLALALPTAALAMTNPTLGREEAGRLTDLLRGGGGGAETQLASAWAAAAYVDSLHPGEGAVILDTFVGNPVVLASRDARQFVITSDRDFPSALSDPAGAGAHYLLVPNPAYLGSLASFDALNRTYPRLYASGAGLGELVREFDGPTGLPEWRLYAVRAAPSA